MSIKGLLLSACLSMAPLGAEAEVASFTVEGQGETAFAARQDAIRTALQQQVDQLIVADRVVANDELVLDRVMSTMNGYVESFEILEQNAMGDGVHVTARVAISESMITNYISEFRAEGSAIDGASIFGELQRRQAQKEADRMRRAANGRIFDRLFSGFPAETTQVELLDVALVERGDVGRSLRGDYPDSSFARLRLRVSFDPTFLDALRTTIRTFEIAECYDEMDDRDEMRREPVKIDGVDVYDPWPFKDLSGKHSQNIDCPPYVDKNNMFCLAEASKERCFVLEPGDYTRTWNYNPRSYIDGLVYLAFTDDQERDAMNTDTCIEARFHDRRSDYALEGIPLRGTFNDSSGFSRFTLEMMPFITDVDIPIQEVDMARAHQFHAIVGFRFRNGPVLDLMPMPGSEPVEGCDKLREVIALSQ